MLGVKPVVTLVLDIASGVEAAVPVRFERVDECGSPVSVHFRIPVGKFALPDITAMGSVRGEFVALRIACLFESAACGFLPFVSVGSRLPAHSQYARASFHVTWRTEWSNRSSSTFDLSLSGYSQFASLTANHHGASLTRSEPFSRCRLLGKS